MIRKANIITTSHSLPFPVRYSFKYSSSIASSPSQIFGFFIANKHDRSRFLFIFSFFPHLFFFALPALVNFLSKQIILSAQKKKIVDSANDFRWCLFAEALLPVPVNGWVSCSLVLVDLLAFCVPIAHTSGKHEK